ncbi:MAG: hypothetical protein ABF811_03325 [Pseudoclavibacter sp.]
MSHDLYDILINGNGLWLLWAYFIGELITYDIVKLVHSRSYDVWIGLLLIVCYFFTAHYAPDIQLPFQIVQRRGNCRLHTALRGHEEPAATGTTGESHGAVS